ncbi:MAG: hypothetical protein GTO40_01855, partial [Deltaproteobacteria bacterium]|nr:hypothetical protein [Deltaproteobacteria bacterium]
FDWVEFFSQGRFPSIWMPWTKSVVRFLDLPAVFALTILGVGLRAYRKGSSPLALALALISLPTLWVLFMGNLDGLALVGLLVLPWGAPLVLIKPQIASFALLARWRSFVLTGIWLIFSFIVWGLWPLKLDVVFTSDWKAEWLHDITLFPWGL